MENDNKIHQLMIEKILKLRYKIEETIARQGLYDAHIKFLMTNIKSKQLHQGLIRT